MYSVCNPAQVKTSRPPLKTFAVKSHLSPVRDSGRKHVRVRLLRMHPDIRSLSPLHQADRTVEVPPSKARLLIRYKEAAIGRPGKTTIAKRDREKAKQMKQREKDERRAMRKADKPDRRPAQNG